MLITSVSRWFRDGFASLVAVEPEAVFSKPDQLPFTGTTDGR